MTTNTIGLDTQRSRTGSINKALWIIQWLLALLFVFAGGMKLVLPIEEMTKEMTLPGPFLRFIGVAELLGGLGLILPGLTGIRPVPTPLAAAGLTIIMIGATVLSLQQSLAAALLPVLTGLLLAFVAYGRLRLAPHRETASIGARTTTAG